LLLSASFATAPLGERVNNGRVLSPRGRLLLAGFGLSAIALMATARTLTPDPRGYGTHEQLGLASCRFARWTGWRCPTCGVTTAWAHATRGDVQAALAANVSGTLLFGLFAVASPWAIASATAGRWLGGRPAAGLVLTVSGGLLLLAVLDWVRRLATG
jgi:Protein of unknown function (DUF2752)